MSDPWLGKYESGTNTSGIPSIVPTCPFINISCDKSDVLINAGCVAYISTNFYKQIRLDPAFIKTSDLSQEMLIKGQVGTIEGIPLILVPDSYFPNHGSDTLSALTANLTNLSTIMTTSGSKVEFVLSNSAAIVGCEKLTDYKVHDNPPGINGYLVEGRVCYDAFVLDKKQDMIYVHITK